MEEQHNMTTSEQEASELLGKKDSINLTENPVEFNLNPSSFSRSLLKGKRRISSASSCSENAAFAGGSEVAPFFENGTESKKVVENVLVEQPEDRYHLCYIVVYILGFGSLLPWNFFITANAYFRKKLETRPTFQVSFQNYFSVAAMVPNVIMMLLNIFFLQRYDRVIRMRVAVVMTFLIFVLTTALVLMDTTNWTVEFFAVTISSVVTINIFSAILQGGLFGFVGMLPSKYTQAVMAGQGLSGVFAAVASIISQLGVNNVYHSAFGYFFTACIVLLICFVAIFVLFRMEFVKHYTSDKKYKCTCNCDSLVHDHLPDFINEDANEKLRLQENKKKQRSKNKNNSYLFVFKKIFPMAFSIMVMFWVTLACFPSITARVISVSDKKTTWTEIFVSVTCFLFFNLGDYFGRTLAGFFQFPKKHMSKWALPIISFCRLIFIPLFIFCNAQPRSFPVIFNHDAFPAIFMLLFSTSNGYFGSLAMMYGPSSVDGEYAELAGTIMACCLSIGLGLGAASSFLVTSFI